MTLISFLKEILTDTVRTLTSKEGLKNLYCVSLYRNAVYLMLNLIVVAVTGFGFWIVAIKLCSIEGVGLASAAISTICLLALLSDLGLDYRLIRFLPCSGERVRDTINSYFTLREAISVILSFIFLAGLNIWSPALLLIRKHPMFLTTFWFYPELHHSKIPFLVERYNYCV